MSKKLRQRLNRRKRNLRKRLSRELSKNRKGPILQGKNVHYDMSDRIQATAWGGLGTVHQMALKLELDKEINKALSLLKQHRPYFESDHVLSIAYSVLCGATCIEDMGLFRQDIALLNGLGASRLPAPSTAGDFLRRFESQEQIDALQNALNGIRQGLWLEQDEEFRRMGIINVDGTLAPTLGECKEGTDFAYDKTFGYHPLVVSLQNTREPLFLLNRPGNSPSHEGSAPYIDRALDLAGPVFEKVYLRGDTDFALTSHFDKWDERCTFVLGVDAMPNLREIAESLEEDRWEELVRGPKYEVRTEPRQRPENVRERIVKERGYKNVRLRSEQVAEFDYRPGKCNKDYRMIVVRKNISVEKGDDVLFDDIVYFFYITNDFVGETSMLVYFANERADHENDIDQLKNAVGAMQSPCGDLLSNGAYMVIASLAWSLKAWIGLHAPETKADEKGKTLKDRLLRMEFKTFLRTFMQHPCQIVRQGRRIIWKILGYHDKTAELFQVADAVRSLRC